jgi:membrane protein YdbS with pleckstrin-like domain
MALPRKFLNDDEELLVEMRPHWVFFAGPLFAAAAVVAAVLAILVAFSPPNWATDILLLLAAIPVLWFLGRLLRWRTYTLVLTTTRIVVRRGVLGRNTTQIRLQRITEICISQKLWERVIATGRLLIDVQGEDDAVVLEFIRKPAIVQRVINGQINELTGGGRAEPVPQELLGYRRRPTPPEPEHAGDTPPFGVPIVNAQGEPWTPSMPWAPTAPTPPASAGPPSAPAAPPPAAGAPPQPTVVPGPTGPTGPAGPGEIRDRLIELDDLRQRKIISEEEFAAKKAELLSRI